MFTTRLGAALQRSGEEFTCGGKTWRGVFRILDSGTMRSYLDDVEAMGVNRPGLLLVTQAASEVDRNDRITRDGREYTVLKVSCHRIADLSVVKIAVLA